MTAFEFIRLLLEAWITGQMGLFAIYLILAGDKRPARLALAGLAAIFATIAIINALTATGFALWLRPVNLVLELSLGPAIYLFIQQMRDQPPVIGRLSLGHLFPLVLGPILLALVNIVPVDAIVVGVHTVYMVAIGRSLLRGRHNYWPGSSFRFVSLFAGFFITFILLRVAVSVEASFGNDFRATASYAAILVAMLFLSAAIIVTALRRPELLTASIAFTKYAGSIVAPGEIDLILERLDRLFHEEHLFRNPNLSLTDLAARIKAPAKHVSQAVNDRRGMSVPNYINDMRVAAAAAELQSASEPKPTITVIMHNAGFGSKSTFQREFQRRHGMSPSAFRQQSQTPKADA